MRRERPTWVVTGSDPTPDGYHDEMLYEGKSWWGALRAIWAGRRNGLKMDVTYR
ncbi:hypothetical protein I5G59_gp51 [Mycobacterium phage LilMcDreamy]|uniref:Uncharacterized protein n=1 Tax=Mycobacterium phage LilMcDreamy TaxID=2652422 RepID=A0A5P8D7K9_9CAUD|nr:hypothetical protein I5G59_gp51 [Mycobacterium phage LilMcDreamy]QFP94671.1 hypothetical protein SEA_LILMCDREAMY_51 [Mycobacterium phage LilMcDreamy]